MQTRRQEMEDDIRLRLRQEMREHNKKLASAAKQAGVILPVDYAIALNNLKLKNAKSLRNKIA
jgi:DNA-damage-inducible protein D